MRSEDVARPNIDGAAVRTVVTVLLLLGGCSEGAPDLVQPDTPLVPAPPLVATINVRDFGAKGDGQSDDSAAFDAAIRALPVTGGIILVPAGTYMLRAIHTNPLHVIDLSNKRNVTIAGQGSEATILRMASTSYHSAIHIILVQRSSGITLRDLTLDGNRRHILYADEQSHGIQIQSSTDVRIEGVRFQFSGGDGVRLFGSADEGSWAERIWIENSHFQDNARNGISIQRAARDIVIRGNTFERISDQSISAEPTGNSAPHDILVEGNVIRHESKNWAVALAGVSPQDVLERLIFRNNRLENGTAYLLWIDGLVLDENTILGDPYHSALRLQDVSNALVSDNDITGVAQEEFGVVQILNEDFALSSNVTLRSNRISVAPGLTAIYVRDALGGITVLENQLLGSGNGIGIMFQNLLTVGTTRAGFFVTSNVVQDFAIGVAVFDRGDNYSNVIVRNNAIDDQTGLTESVGILFDGTGPYGAFAQVMSNTFGSGIYTTLRVR